MRTCQSPQTPLRNYALATRATPPPFESTYDVGEWNRQSVQGQTVDGKAKESGKNDKSTTCATSDTDDNESDWETCSDCSEEISNNKPNCPPTSGHVRRDVTENNHKTPSTSAPSNKITGGENTASEFPPIDQSEQAATPITPSHRPPSTCSTRLSTPPGRPTRSHLTPSTPLNS
jgi:hypothetical protein